MSTYFTLKMYNLDYIVNFPTRTNESSETTIDNIFLDISKYINFVIEPGYNGLSDHTAGYSAGIL